MYVCENRSAQIPREAVCDGIENCSDGSDEKYCNQTSLSLASNYPPYVPQKL